MRRRSSTDPKGLTFLELAAGALLAGVLAMAGVTSFGEADLRARMVRANHHLQSLSAAMEAYKADNGGYTISDKDSYLEAPYPRISTIIEFRLLTTPVAYLPCILTDPMRPNLETRLRAYAVHIRSNGEPTFDLYPRDCFQAWSYGPDGRSESMSFRALKAIIANESLPEPDTTAGGIRYDPTNGLMSVGDIYRFGGKSE